LPPPLLPLPRRPLRNQPQHRRDLLPHRHPLNQP
jgi:hypothetical protein